MTQESDIESIPRSPDNPSWAATFTYPSSLTMPLAKSCCMGASTSHAERLRAKSKTHQSQSFNLTSPLIYVERQHIPNNATDSITLLGCRPPPETSFVNIISAGSFTPDDFLCLGLKFHKTYWAVALDGPSFPRLIFLRRVVMGVYRSVRENLTKFLVINHYYLNSTDNLFSRERLRTTGRPTGTQDAQLL